jgi:hypothetical protein
MKMSYKKKQVETTKQKGERREKSKPEEGMPQRQHCHPAKRRGDRNPTNHEE